MRIISNSWYKAKWVNNSFFEFFWVVLLTDFKLWLFDLPGIFCEITAVLKKQDERPAPVAHLFVRSILCLLIIIEQLIGGRAVFQYHLGKVLLIGLIKIPNIAKFQDSQGLFEHAP